jgi:hypothetical protein
MAVLTSNSAVSSTGLNYRGSIVDMPYTGSVVVRSILPDCDGSLILFWEKGVLIGQFWSNKRTLELLSDPGKLVYNAEKTTVVADKSPIAIKVGKYYARYFPGSSAYYAHAAIRSSCGGCWCSMPCDRIWSVVGGSTIQSLHQTEGTIPEYDEWIPMGYYLGIYGTAFNESKESGSITPTVNNSDKFSSKLRRNELATAKSIAAQVGTVISGGGGSVTGTQTGFIPLEVVDSTGAGIDFLDFNTIDFCAEVKCESPKKPIGVTTAPTDCCTEEITDIKKPQSGDCGCS